MENNALLIIFLFYSRAKGVVLFFFAAIQKKIVVGLNFEGLLFLLDLFSKQYNETVDFQKCLLVKILPLSVHRCNTS